MATASDAWKEVCLIGVIPSGGSEVQWAGMTEDITGMDWGDKDIEGAPLLNGGRVAKFTPQADESVTMKTFPVDALRGADGVVQWFNPAADTAQPVYVPNTRTRTQHKLIFLWATTLSAAAGTAPAVGEAAYRIQIGGAYCTSYKPSFDDKTLQSEVTFKWTPFQKNGNPNKVEESTDGSSALPATTTSVTSFT